VSEPAAVRDNSLLLVTGGIVRGERIDLLLRGDRIASLQPPATAPTRTGDGDGVVVVDVRGATLLPGLHDHHVHLRAWAAVALSVQVGPPAVTDAAGMAAALAGSTGAPETTGGWLRAVGYHQSVAGDLDRHALDRLAPDRPVRVQHRSGALWILNSRGLAAIGVPDGAPWPAEVPDGVERDGAGRPTGRLWRCDDWLGGRVPRPPSAERSLGEVSRIAARRGVTGFTDASPGRGLAELQALGESAARGVVGQRLHLMAAAGTAFPAGSEVPTTVTVGPVKVLLDDDRLPTLDDLTSQVAAAHRSGRPVAMHCVTRVQAVVAIAAFEAAGPLPGDRIEHGAILDDAQIPQIRALGLTVVTQPGFVAARGDRYLRDVEPADLDSLWRLRSLLDGGVATAASSDAPLGPTDPWTAVRAAVTRRTDSGQLLGPGERVGLRQAIGIWAGAPDTPATPRRLAVGGPADICAVRLGDGPPSWASRHGPEVVLTVAAGKVLHQIC
jgi:predicted amidohydrolase YtcJ